MTTTRISSPPSGLLVDTVRNVHMPSVRDLNWVEGSDYITVTTDDEVNLFMAEVRLVLNFFRKISIKSFFRV